MTNERTILLVLVPRIDNTFTCNNMLSDVDFNKYATATIDTKNHVCDCGLVFIADTSQPCDEK